MTIISANELKKKGISILNDKKNEETIISVHGKNKFVILDMETYNHLRECELESALLEARKDLKENKFHIESVEKHINRIKNG